MLAEGLGWKNNRDDRTPIELFLRGAGAADACFESVLEWLQPITK
jgi:hypothetical protein